MTVETKGKIDSKDIKEATLTEPGNELEMCGKMRKESRTPRFLSSTPECI